MLVRDVIKEKARRVITVGTETPVKDALALFVEHNIGSLPVLDDQGHLIGIFTERDVLFGCHREFERFHRRPIREVMTLNPVTCAPGDSIALAMAKLAQHHIGQLPVVENNQPVGIVSVGDLIKAFCRELETENRHLMNYLYGRT